MTKSMDVLLEAVMYFPAKPKQIFVPTFEDDGSVYVIYEFLSGKKRKLRTLTSVIQDNDFQVDKQALFSANQLQTGEIIIVRVHPADSLISIERRRS